MSVVTFSGCTKVEASYTVHVTHDSTITEVYASSEITSITYSCFNGLSAHYGALVDGGKATSSEKAQLDKHIVGPGKCGADICGFLYTKVFYYDYPTYTGCRLYLFLIYSLKVLETKTDYY